MTLSAYPAARTRARERWHALADRLRTVRPESLVKGTIGLVLVGGSLALAVASWPALAPFVVGAVLAYAVLPIANRLDAVMPRVLAALLAELVAVGLLVGVAVLVVPPLLNGLLIVAQRLPTPDEIQAAVASLQTQMGSIPEPMRTIALSVVTQTTANLQGALQDLSIQAADVLTAQILGIFDTASNVLGLLVIPAWILTIVADERSIKRRAGRLFPGAIREDVLALFRIADRTLATFLRVRVLLGVVTGVLVWAGLSIAGEMGIGSYKYAVAAGVLLGTLQLIPELGYFLGFFPVLLVYVIGGPVAGAVMTLTYIGAVRISSSMVETRVSRGVLDVHPGLLIPAIVVLSQFGVIWLLAAAPVVAIIRDLVRYANSRLADPPGPAGVLPGEGAKQKAGSGRNAAGVPSVYRAPAPRPAPILMTPRSGGSPAATAAAATAAAAATVAPIQATGPTPVPTAYANLRPGAGGRQPSATVRSIQQ